MRRSGNWWKTSLRIVVCLLLLLWIFHSIFVLEGKRYSARVGDDWGEFSRVEQWKAAWTQGPNELWATVQKVAPGNFALSVVFMGATIALGMIRWRCALKVQGLDLSFGRTAEISLVAHFFNSFLLGSTGGDLLKAYYAARETKHRKTEAVSTVFVDRVLGLFSMLAFACLMMAPNFRLLRDHPAFAVVAWVIGLMLVACSGLLVLAFWGGVSKRAPRAREWLRRLPKADLLERGLAACRQCGRDWRFLVKMISLSMALNVFCVLQIWALAQGLDMRLPLVSVFLIAPMVISISALPITLSGLGVRENLYVLLMSVSTLGGDQTKALSLSLLAYAGSLIWSMIGGLVYVSRKNPDHLQEIQEEAESEAEIPAAGQSSEKR